MKGFMVLNPRNWFGLGSMEFPRWWRDQTPEAVQKFREDLHAEAQAHPEVQSIVLRTSCGVAFMGFVRG